MVLPSRAAWHKSSEIRMSGAPCDKNLEESGSRRGVPVQITDGFPDSRNFVSLWGRDILISIACRIVVYGEAGPGIVAP